MALETAGYGPEESDRDATRLDRMMDQLEASLKVFDQAKVSPEDIQKVEAFKNSTGVIARSINVKRECKVAGGKTAAQRLSLESAKRAPKR